MRQSRKDLRDFAQESVGAFKGIVRMQIEAIASDPRTPRSEKRRQVLDLLSRWQPDGTAARLVGAVANDVLSFAVDEVDRVLRGNGSTQLVATAA